MSLNSLLRGPGDFCWATGIEDTFIPQTRPGMRALDEYALTQHYDQWEQDLHLAASLGVRAIRWGIPWYRVEPASGRFDWSWTDQVLEAMVHRFHLTPVLDLMHYGTPLWMENSFINSRYPERVAAYASAVGYRYRGLVDVFTPLNEPMVNVDFCGRRAEWPPYLEGDDGYVKLLMAISRGIIETIQALRAAQPDCTLVQVEALWRFHTTSPQFQEQVRLENLRQYLAFDLFTGRVGGDHPLLPYLLENGARDADLDWFAGHAVSVDIFGANFYPWSYGRKEPGRDGKLRLVKEPVPGSALGEVIRDAYERYRLPVMVTETSANEPVAGRARWMDETIAAVRELRAEGLPVVGYTWFPMMTMIDWAYRKGRRPLDDYLIHLGLFDSAFDDRRVLRRAATDLAARYREHIANFPNPSAEDGS